ncbi:MAG TPA: hypothetical protein VMZ04_03555 [Anaerolineae bacterium]|nr:hypothetical protein [Anaerolineae bacterium]
MKNNRDSRGKFLVGNVIYQSQGRDEKGRFTKMLVLSADISEIEKNVDLILGRE